MEKKTAGPNAQQRIYMLGRFRKAVKWATLFSHLCSLKGDSRTSLEAEVCFIPPFFFLRKLKSRNFKVILPYEKITLTILTLNNFFDKIVLQAYASYMKGTLLFEQEKNIEAAMTNFKNTRLGSRSLVIISCIYFSIIVLLVVCTYLIISATAKSSLHYNCWEIIDG